jgi:hypothetical protein
MKTYFVFFLALLVLNQMSCTSQDKTSETKTTVTVPKVDLHSAVVTEDLDIIRQHISAKSDLNVLEPSRASTPLITAAAFGKTTAAKILIAGGADLNYQNVDGSTALHTAAFFGRTEIVRALVTNNANKNLKNKRGQTAYDIVNMPLEDHLAAYDVIGGGLQTAGFIIDHAQLEAARPAIAELLK